MDFYLHFLTNNFNTPKYILTEEIFSYRIGWADQEMTESM